MGIDAFGGHRQIEIDFIAGRPFAVDHRITEDHPGDAEGLAVELQLDVPGPAGDAQLEGEAGRTLGVDSDPDLSGPRISGDLLQPHRAAAERKPGGARAIKMYGDRILGDRIEIAADRGNEA